MKPLIGITTSELRPGALRTLSRSSGAPHDETFLGTTYFRAVERAGGLPVMLAPGDPALAGEIVARLDGVLLSGGPDIHPSFYGAEPDPQLGPTWPEADASELAVARAAIDAGMPVLGVCRGAQLINVARGGTLVQHVDGCRQTEAADVATETVRIAARTRLHGLLRARELEVNSFHHQMVDRLGGGLRVSARAGRVVKAIEAPGHPFLLGVQWHAEALADGRLFEALVAASSHLGLRIAA
jgi:putative glutamine amidotransferase